MPTFIDEYGVPIVYYAWPVDHPRAIVQLVHGVGEHALRYREVARALNLAGYTVYADDHRGHGQTGMRQHGGNAEMLGRLGPGGLRAAVAAVHGFSDEIRRLTLEQAEPGEPALPLVLVGHSWGSFMAQMLVNQHPDDYQAVVLTGTAYRWPGYLDSGDLNRKHKHLGSTGAEWLSRDPAVAAAFVADPLTTSVPLARLFGLRDAARILGRPARGLPAGLPLLIQVGGDDPVGGERSAQKLAQVYRRRSGLTDVRVIVYPGARHEVFNETNRDEVLADLVSWLNTYLPEPAGTAPTDD
ncbi:alpha/beta fold hydrolase [Cryobacterium arcticum]|uniref:Lysophospholipase n=1 Tax=Cryobacterium arcticum TaxID=670052 RepID=A0A1B1BF15_9MICO|nr:alpha/beta fold hydrolase [Cryobacterium arcticum]ANP71147.1 lysophospholipase [Cryobacterium arcticum]